MRPTTTKHLRNNSFRVMLLSLTLLAHSSGSNLLAEDSLCCSVAAHALSSAAQIKPGIKRKDIDKVFTQDGGISFRAEGRYVFRECPYIKIKIKFSEDGAAIGNESPEDVITEISSPYLEAPMKD
jgi:hypothetical protein